MRKFLFVAAILFFPVFGMGEASCSPRGDKADADSAPPRYARSRGADRLTVVSFNIWGGAEEPQYSPTLAALKDINADIIGIQEANGSIGKYAKDLGFYGSPNTNIISRFPIKEEFTQKNNKAYGVRIYLPHLKRSIYVFNSHLYHAPYSPYQVRDGETPDESIREEEVKKALELIATSTAPGSEIIFLGDHNSVSHIDWEGRGYDWPVSQLITEFGFIDSFRVLFPDASKHPGHTWSPGYPGRPANDTNDRIDYIYFTGVLLQPLYSETLDQTTSVKNWPSDHRAVVTYFKTRAE